MTHNPNEISVCLKCALPDCDETSPGCALNHDRAPVIRRNEQGYRVGECHGKASIPDSTVRRARRMRERGYTYERIGDELGVNRRTVADWVNFRTRADA
jgi:transposase-like protein